MKKTKVKIMCLVCKNEFWKNLCRLKIGKGKLCSVRCYGASRKGTEAWNKGIKGGISRFRGQKRPELARENHWNWQGGKSVGGDRTNSLEWKILRRQIYQRDHWTCQKCLKHCSGGDIQCHHMVPYRRSGGGESKLIYWNMTINDTSNLITLCRSCHAKEGKRIVEAEKGGNYGLQAVFHLVA